MKTKLITITLVSLVAFLLVIPALVLAEEPSPVWTEPSIPGRVEGAGTFFEITDSEYLNISLQSSEEITIILESMPKTISLTIEASFVFSSTTLTISDLEPNKTYYKFEDSYKNEIQFVSDEGGSYTWTQDLTQPHHIWFQPEDNGTIYLPDQCTTYGIWDESTSTCTLTQDLTESVEITKSNIVLDCNNYSITGAGSGYGIYLNNKEGVAIKSCATSNLGYGIVLVRSSYNTLINNTIISYYAYGIWLNHYSDGNTLTNNIVNSPGDYGICIDVSENNILRNNKISNNSRNFRLIPNGSHGWNNDIDTSNTVDGKPIYYIRNATNQVYDGSTNAGTFYCISCDNVIVRDLMLIKNMHGILFWNTSNSRIENVTVSGNDYGIDLLRSNSNVVIANTISGNYFGIRLESSGNNSVFGNNINSNSAKGISLGSSESNILKNNLIVNNWSNFNISGDNLSHYIHDIDASNKINGKSIYYLVNQTDKVIDSNSDPGYIGVINSRNIAVKNLTLEEANLEGVLLAWSTQSHIENANILNSYYGIRLLYASDNNIKNNILKNTYGIYSRNSLSNNIEGNDFSAFRAIWFLYSSDNIITKNDISESWHGILISYSSNDNFVYHNNFYIPRGVDVYGSSGNLFDKGYPDGGNYWSDYDTAEEGCFDTNNDGFCDSPYIFTGGQDRYPFMEESGWEVLVGRIFPDEAVGLAKEVTGANYLWGGKGYDLNESRFVESQKIKNTGYNYWNQEIGEIDFGKGLDCSGLSFWSYNRAYYENAPIAWEACVLINKECPIAHEGADAQYRYNSYEIEREILKPGDLLFFDVVKDKYGTIDHVAMYVGENNVIHAEGVLFSQIIEEDLDIVLARYGADFKGFRRVIDYEDIKDPLTMMQLVLSSPANLIVTDPDGITLNQELREVPGMYYYVFDIDGDGKLDDIIDIPERKMGNYLIAVVPEPDVLPTDTYTLKVTAAETTIILAENVPISEIPSEGYGIRSTETAIEKMISTKVVYTGDTSGYYSDSVNLSAVLTDEDNNSLPDKTLTFQIGEQSFSVTTNENGRAEIEWNVNLIPKEIIETYSIIVIFAGNDYYLSTKGEGEFTLKSAKWLKQDAISELESAKTGDKRTDWKIDRIIKHIQKSLDENLWIDSSYLIFFKKDCFDPKIFELDPDRMGLEGLFELEPEKMEQRMKGIFKGKCFSPKLGIRVFHEEYIATKLMLMELKGKPRISEELKNVFEEVIAKLVKADKLLAKVAIFDAKNTLIQNPKFKKIVELQIKKAEEELIKAERELSQNKPDKAIMRLSKAWLHAQIAIKFAEFGKR